MRSRVTVAIVALALAGVVALLVLSRPSAPLTGSTVTPPANIPTVESSAGASATPPASQTPREDPTDSPSPSAPASAAVSTRLPSPSPQPSAPCGDHLIIYDGPEPTITNQVRSPEIFVAEVVGVADAALVPIGEHEPGEGVGAIRSDAYRRLTLDVRDVAKGPGGPPAIRSIMVPGGTVGCAHFMVAGMPDHRGQALRILRGSTERDVARRPIGAGRLYLLAHLRCREGRDAAGREADHRCVRRRGALSLGVAAAIPSHCCGSRFQCG